MKPELTKFTATVGNQEISFETGQLAQQAGGAVTVRLNESLIFASATMSNSPARGSTSSPSAWIMKRECTPVGVSRVDSSAVKAALTENAILTARLTDRPLRPLFPKDMRNDVQVIMYTLSADDETPLDVIAINAASAAVIDLRRPLGRTGRRSPHRLDRWRIRRQPDLRPVG